MSVSVLRTRHKKLHIGGTPGVDGIRFPDGTVQTTAGAGGGVGPAGPQGPIGPQGPVGPAGSNGSNGAVGPIGPVGPAGPIGQQGLPGDSHWLLNGSNTYYNDGDVGIGTSSPLCDLHVLRSGGNSKPPTTVGVQFNKSNLVILPKGDEAVGPVIPGPVVPGPVVPGPIIPLFTPYWFYIAVGGTGSTGIVDVDTRFVRKTNSDLHFQTQSTLKTVVFPHR